MVAVFDSPSWRYRSAPVVNPALFASLHCAARSGRDETTPLLGGDMNADSRHRDASLSKPEEQL
jgi:hypothetical protein